MFMGKGFLERVIGLFGIEEFWRICGSVWNSNCLGKNFSGGWVNSRYRSSCWNV